jgi:hypothetical protein
MSSDLLSIVGSVAAFGALTLFLTFRSKRKYAEQWQGSVTRISRMTGDGDDSPGRDLMRIEYRRDDGKTGRVDLDEATFQSRFAGVKPGDRLAKRPGEGMPERA